MGYRLVRDASHNHPSRSLHGTHGARDAMTVTGSGKRWHQCPVLQRHRGRAAEFARPPPPAGHPAASGGRTTAVWALPGHLCQQPLTWASGGLSGRPAPVPAGGAAPPRRRPSGGVRRRAG